jgi:predicted RNase H-like HicB family nuclease
MVDAILKKAEELSNRNYKISVSIDITTTGETLYMAKNPELIGCMAQGETLEDAISNLKDARLDYIYDSLKDGFNVPEPAPIAVQTLDTAGILSSEDFKVYTTVTFNKAVETVIKPSHREQLYEAWLET